jgi:misacylated tRNA(Ala) deacylase
MTSQLYLDDQTMRSFTATVESIDADGARAKLDQTAFYATGGGQPHDVGTLTWVSETGEPATANVINVRKEDADIWHTLEGDLPPLGTTVTGQVEWNRRHQLMRTHTAMHILCGVIWNEYQVPVTGGNMEPLKARMDFEFDPLPDGFAERVEALINAEITADRPIEVSALPRETAVLDHDLIRTKVNLIPESVTQIRIVDIVGLDKQADGGTHVPSTGEVGHVRITKTESKGKGNKRIRFEID